jgi:hypothetical protein
VAGVSTIEPGTIVELSAGQWAYGDGPLRLRVDRVRDDLSIYYDDRIWLEGHRLDEAGVPVEWLQALVSVDVLDHHPNGTVAGGTASVTRTR